MTSPAARSTAPAWLPFELERWQSDFEHNVKINIADSGVEPVTVDELLGEGGLSGLAEHALHYPEVNGTARLRERIAALYPGAHPDQVLVTVGAAEANSLIAQTVLQPGDRAVVMTPGYQQIRGLALNLGASVEDFPLRPDECWRPDLDALQTAAGAGATLLSINSPNNPTGTILAADEFDAVSRIAEQAGAWLHSDEVYRGSEFDGPESPSAWGRSERALVVGSLSKAYGLSGLRIGWVVGPHDVIADLWRRHEYATISAASLSMAMAEIALAEPARSRLLERQKALARAGRTLLLDWVAANDDLLAITPPAATALGFPRLLRHNDSVAVATAIKDRADVLVAPGVYLGADAHLRLSHSLAPEHTEQAFSRIADVLRTL